jgi:signal transduction histidine kinase
VDQIDEQQRLQKLELTSIQSTTRTVTIGLIAFLLVVLALFHREVPPDRLGPWGVAFVAFVLARLWLIRKRGDTDPTDTPHELRRWRQIVMVLSLMAGVLVGSLGWVAFPFVDLPGKIILTFMVMTVCRSATYNLSDMPLALFLLRVAAIGPFAVAWHVLPSPYQNLAPGLLVFAVLFWGMYARNHGRAEREKWSLVVRNEQLAHELTRRNTELQASDVTKNRLFAVAGHDLRQPVHAIGLMVEQIRQDLEPAVFRQLMNRLRQASQLASDMLHDLMDFSNLERQDYAVRHETVALGPLLEQVRESLDAVAHAKHLQLRVSRTAQLLAVSSDPNLLRRMLLNLVSNAIKYTESGGVSVECEREGDEVAIRVCDTGIGIPQEHLKDVFDDYVRVGGSQRKDEGLGLGLSVVRRAAERLGHRLALSSTPGRGSVFEVRAAAAPLPMQHSAPAPLYAPLHRGEVVLVVEDDEYAREALRGLLAQWGFVPAAGRSAREALDQLSPDQRPSMVITDYQLSASEDGFDCIGLVRNTTGDKGLPALLMTGDISPAIRPKAAAAGVSVAHKPITPPMLRQRIQALLAGSPQEA